MKTFKLLVFIFLLSSSGGQAQINLVGASTYSATGYVEILKWQVFDSSSATAHPTILQGYYMGSSVFDAYNGTYYLTGLTSTSAGLLSFNTITNEATLSPYSTFSNITEIDMSTGKLYSLSSDSIGYINVNEVDINTGTISSLGVINEPGVYGINTDATSFNSDDGILYYVGMGGFNSICLYAIDVRNPVFSYTKTTLLTTNANIFGVNYDNANDKIYACSIEYDPANTYNYIKIVEIDKITGEVIAKGVLAGIPSYVVGSSSFDQNSGSLLLVGIDTNNVMKMIVFDTYTNAYQTGYVPGSVSEIVCDNHAFAQNRYGIVSVNEKKKPDVSIYPNPATNKFTLNVKGFESNSVVKIYNLNGVECFSGQIYSPQTEISIEFLPKGFYFVTMQNQMGHQTRKLIID
jgi:hypothetical protein